MSDHARVADEITARIDDLAAAAVAGMYTNPFWDARYGDRGRRAALDDQRHHLEHLVLALQAQHPDLLREYAQWLQVVLTSRGMCTRHLADNFVLLSDLIDPTDGPDMHPARHYLNTAVAALVYREGPAGTLNTTAEALAVRAVTDLLKTQRLTSSVTDDDEAQVRDDVSYHLSYLADALALGRPELFVAHVRWTDQFFVSLGKPAGLLRHELLAIDNALAEYRDDDLVAARTVLRGAIDALAEVGS
jgi:hypothetical protein